MEEKVRKALYDHVDNPWEFIVESADEYKKEFAKTSKIGVPPSVDEILSKKIMEKLDEKKKS